MRELAMTTEIAEDIAKDNRRPRRSEVSRRQILDVAAKLFRARGYTETALRDIGRQVGIKAGSIYYHFESKEQLANEVLGIGVRRVHDTVVMAIDELGAKASARSKLEAAMTAHLETLLDESDYTSAHIRCFPYVPQSVRDQLSTARRDYEVVWRQILDDFAASDCLSPGADPSAVRLVILGALNWSLEWYDPTRGKPSQLIQTLLAAFSR